MQKPKVVKRHPTMAFKYLDHGSLNDLVQWIEGHNHHEVVIGGEVGIPGVLRIRWEGKAVDLPANYWVVYEMGDYWVYDDETYLKNFEDASSESADLVETSTESSTNVFITREIEVAAVQFPIQRGNEASKDYEERFREFVRHIMSFGCEIEHFELSVIDVRSKSILVTLTPGDWAVNIPEVGVNFHNPKSFDYLFKEK